MRTAILILIALMLLPTAAAFSRKPSLSQQDLDRRWQQYMSNPGDINELHGFPYKECFVQSAAKYNLPRSLLLAFARGESNFDATAKSSANAYGLMQILWPSTAKDLGIKSLQQLLEPCINVDAGARYIRRLLDRYQGNMHKTVAAYNYGPGRIPLDGANIPAGAAWYSDYILRHLDYVQQQTDGRSGLIAIGQMFVIAFDRPYRAGAFVDRLQPSLGDLRLDYFRREDGSFHVLMQYDSNRQKQRGRKKLREMGLDP